MFLVPLISHPHLQEAGMTTTTTTMVPMKSMVVIIVVLLLPPLIMENDSSHRKIGMCHGIWPRNLSITSNVDTKIERSNENGNNNITIVPLHTTYPLRIDDI
jgi:hypothetical protein